MDIHIIPVAFEVAAPSDAEAAELLVNHLVRNLSYHEDIHSWSTPNHPAVDRSDDEGHRLAWIRVPIARSLRCIQAETTRDCRFGHQWAGPLAYKTPSHP